MLNNAGYRMRSKLHPNGTTFTKDTITVMLMNPFYAGWVLQPGETYRSWAGRLRNAARLRRQHEPIISQDLFDRAQQVRYERRGKDERMTEHRGGVIGQRHHAYVAAGIARCHVCGIRLRAQGKIGRPAQYRCTRHERGEVCASTRKSTAADLVDMALGVALTSLVLSHTWRDEVLAEVKSDTDTAQQVQSRRAAIGRKLGRIRQLLIDGDLTQQEYRAERARLDAELATLKTPAEHVNLERVANLLANLEALWDAATAEERKVLAGQVFEAVYVDLGHRGQVHAVLKPDLLPFWEVIPHGTVRVTDGA